MTRDAEDDLLGYLRHGREAVPWRLDGLGERDGALWTAHHGRLRAVADGFA